MHVHTCLEGVITNKPISCPANAALGREQECEIDLKEKQKQ